MSIYQVDRVQLIKQNKILVLFEYLLVDDIKTFIEAFKEESDILKMRCLQDSYRKKLQELYKLSLNNKTHLLIIVYDSNYKDVFYLKRLQCTNGFKSNVIDFENFQTRFICLNDMSGGSSGSKMLGSVKQTNEDKFTLNLLQTIGNYLGDDDNGLALTKKALNGLPTKGFDFDLFQYIQYTNESIIYEFLKRESEYITNYTANPMRYCWTGLSKDNKQKFISLWTATKKLNGRLFLINYSDEPKEGVGVSEIISLDIDTGIQEEIKYNLTYDEFFLWMKKMNNYESTDRNYLSDYDDKKRHYDQDFFKNWDENKKIYGR